MPEVFPTRQDLILIRLWNLLRVSSCRDQNRRTQQGLVPSQPWVSGVQVSPAGSGDRKLPQAHIDLGLLSLCLCASGSGPGEVLLNSPLSFGCWSRFGVLVAPADATAPILNSVAGKGISEVGKPSPSPCLMPTPGHKALVGSLRAQSKGISEVMTSRERNPEERD